jgi:rubrerythrin
MDPVTKGIADTLLKAIQAEIDGNSLYQMAAQAAEDPKGKEVFELLANEELEHVRFLSSQYRSVVEKGRPDAELKLGKPVDLSAIHPIFSDRIRARLQQANYEMSALSIGIQLELAAIGFYKQAAATTADEIIKAFYSELADWESGHYHALLRQQEALKKDYWTAAGFSPF